MNAATAATTVLVEDGEVPAEKPGLARVVSGALLKSYLEWEAKPQPLWPITPDNAMVAMMDPAPSGRGRLLRWRC